MHKMRVRIRVLHHQYRLWPQSRLQMRIDRIQMRVLRIHVRIGGVQVRIWHLIDMRITALIHVWIARHHVRISRAHMRIPRVHVRII